MELHALIKFNVDFQQPLGGYHERNYNGEPTTNQHHSKKITFYALKQAFLAEEWNLFPPLGKKKKSNYLHLKDLLNCECE